MLRNPKGGYIVMKTNILTFQPLKREVSLKKH
jgi:hypothetical protein